MNYKRISERMGTRFVFKTILTSFVYAMMGVYLLFLISPMFGMNFFVVASNSMQPELERGDLVMINASGSVRVGDVITFTKPFLGAVTHRVVAIVEDDGQTYYICCGDNNLEQDWQALAKDLEESTAEETFAIADDIVTPKEIIGLVKLKFNKMGFVINYLQNNKLIVFIFALLIIYIIKQDDKILEKNIYNYFA